MATGHCHSTAAVADMSDAVRKIVLAGNPNVGKSAIFHALTGIYVEVSNYPGTTVDISSGRLGEMGVFDTPGVYGISAFNEEERVARDMILEADVVINVVDAAHLDRDLFLTLQIIDMGFPTVVALNMMDEAEASGLRVDVAKLAEELGVEVIPTVAVQGLGIEELKAAIHRARPGRPTPAIMDRLPNGLSQAEGLLLLEGDQAARTREAIYRLRRERADGIVAAVVSEVDQGATLAARLGRLTLHPAVGPLFVLAFLALLYEVLGVWLAQDVVGITEGWMTDVYVPWMSDLVGRAVAPDSFLGQVLIGEFGLLTMTVAYLIGLLLPLVVGFYLFLAIAEDSGYLPRVAVLVDRLMTRVGLNGRAVIPMILGFGCVTMATMTTRLMGTHRERTIATVLLSLAIPCSAQLAVITIMIGPLGPAYAAVFALVLLLVYGLAGVIMNRILPGRSSDLLIDLPPLRLPRVWNILHKTFLKTKSFLGEAWMFFAIGALLISVLQATGALAALANGLAPITEVWLGLPREAAQAFIMGFVRRDFGAAGFFDMGLNPHQTLVALLTITLFVPCIASVMIILKERGRKEGAAIWAMDLVLAVLVGGLLHRALFFM